MDQLVPDIPFHVVELGIAFLQQMAGFVPVLAPAFLAAEPLVEPAEPLLQAERYPILNSDTRGEGELGGNSKIDAHGVGRWFFCHSLLVGDDGEIVVAVALQQHPAGDLGALGYLVESVDPDSLPEALDPDIFLVQNQVGVTVLL